MFYGCVTAPIETRVRASGRVRPRRPSGPCARSVGFKNKAAIKEGEVNDYAISSIYNMTTIENALQKEKNIN